MCVCVCVYSTMPVLRSPLGVKLTTGRNTGSKCIQSLTGVHILGRITGFDRNSGVTVSSRYTVFQHQIDVAYMISLIT